MQILIFFSENLLGHQLVNKYNFQRALILRHCIIHIHSFISSLKMASKSQNVSLWILKKINNFVLYYILSLYLFIRKKDQNYQDKRDQKLTWNLTGHVDSGDMIILVAVVRVAVAMLVVVVVFVFVLVVVVVVVVVMALTCRTIILLLCFRAS